jgi:hypothetical protein
MTNIHFSSYPFHPLIPPATSIPIHWPPTPAPPIPRPRARRPTSCVATLRCRSSSVLPASLAPPPRHSSPCAVPRRPHHPPSPPAPAASNLSRRRISPAWALRLLRPAGLPRATALALFPVCRAPTCSTILLLCPPPPPSPLASPSRSLAVGHGGGRRSSSVSHGQRQRAVAALCHGPRPAGGHGWQRPRGAGGAASEAAIFRCVPAFWL